MMNEEEKKQYIKSMHDGLINDELKTKQAIEKSAKYKQDRAAQLRDEIIEFMPSFPESELKKNWHGYFRQVRLYCDNDGTASITFGIQERFWVCSESKSLLSTSHKWKILKKYRWTYNNITITHQSDDEFCVSSSKTELVKIPSWTYISTQYVRQHFAEDSYTLTHAHNLDKDLLFKGILESIAVMLKNEDQFFI